MRDHDLASLGLPYCGASAVPSPGPNPDDRAALEALYMATSGAHWRLKGNWLSDAPLGDWHGVRTDANGRVTVLNLDENNVNGTLPAELGNLTKLKRLEFQLNQLSGEIPPELSSLSNLSFLSFNINRLSGEIPPELGRLSMLEELVLSANDLSGEIPPELGRLSSIRRLYLNQNRLSGEIPPELGNLSNLTLLGLGRNHLTGEIPPELGHLAQSPAVLTGHSRRLPALLGEVAAVQHPHRLRVSQPGR